IERLRNYADKCRGPNGKEWIRWLKQIIKNRYAPQTIEKASSHATMIMHLASKKLPKNILGCNLQGVVLPGAVLSCVKVIRGDFRNADLESTDLEKMDVRMCKMAGTDFGRWPYLGLEKMEYIYCMALSPDRRYLAVWCDTVYIWDWRATKLCYTFPRKA